MAAQQKKDNDWFAWVLIVFLFAVGLAPLALLLLFFKLFGGDGKQKQAAPPPLRTPSAETALRAVWAAPAKPAVPRFLIFYSPCPGPGAPCSPGAPTK